MENKAKIIPKQQLIARLGFNVREVVRDRRQYEISFPSDSFEYILNKYRLLVPAAVHSLGSNYAVRKIVRTDAGNDGSIWTQYEMLVNGDFVMYSDDAFDGKADLCAKILRRSTTILRMCSSIRRTRQRYPPM